MKKFTKAIALCLSLLLCLTFPAGVSAAEVSDATIDTAAKGSANCQAKCNTDLRINSTGER